MSIHAAIIVNAIGQVGVFLNFAKHHPGTNGMRGACRNKKSVSQLHAPMNEDSFQRLSFDSFHELFPVSLRHESDEDACTGLGGNDVPHFRFPAATGGSFMTGCV